MAQDKTLIIVLVALIIGFGAGFVLHPVIVPVEQTMAAANPAPIAATSAEPRGKQYFAAHPDEAHQILAGCMDGSVRGEECFNAEMAVVEADGRARHKKFFGK
ncbi:hypothetical protein SAMN02927924_00993 [Sphingobium faniae]|nr:hypothetical protein SAMN02927924_00993 [Sphingobium faniae]